jgi:L-lactate dehydrogenase complex protein LldG
MSGAKTSSSRQQILNSVRRALRREQPGAAELAAVEQRLTSPQPGLIPQRAQLPLDGQLDLMEQMLRELSASVVRLASDAEVPQAVADYLRNENLPPQLRLAPRDDLRALPWDGQPLLEIAEGIAQADDSTSLTGAFVGIAETGTVMMASGPEAPVTLNFLPENHIVVLRASQVVGAYEEAWQRLRAVTGQGEMPRAVNMITGPSRTGDIEQTIQLGAHGPRRLHVLLVDDRAVDSRNVDARDAG